MEWDILNPVTLDSIHVYQTLLGNWRAYVKDDPNLQAWGHNKDRATMNLGALLAEENIPFDISGDY